MAEPRDSEELIDSPSGGEDEGIEESPSYDESTRNRSSESEDVDPDSPDADLDRDDNVTG